MTQILSNLQIYRVAGPLGFFKGLQARVLYSMPATAICWSTYEFFKYMLSRQSYENYRSTVTTTGGHFRQANTESDKVRSSGGSGADEQVKANLARGYVIPKRNVISPDIMREERAAALSLQTSGVETTTTLLPPAQLPSISGTGVYSSFSYNTMHTDGMYDRKSGRGCNT